MKKIIQVFINLSKLLLILTILAACKLKNNNEVVKEEYYKDGNIKARYSIKDSTYVGKYVEYYENGKVKEETFFENGQQNGEYKSYFSNGTPKKKYEVKHGILEGFSKTYYSNGQLHSIGSNHNNKRSGEWKYYEENGVLQAQGQYNNGLKEGKWEYSPSIGFSIIDWGIHHDDLNGFYLNYPTDWEVKKKLVNQPVVFAAFANEQKGFRSNFNVVIIDIGEDFNLNTVVSQNLEVMKASDPSGNFKLLKEGSTAINDHKALWAIYKIEKDDLKLNLLQFNIKKGTQLFILSFFTLEDEFDDYQGLFKEVAFSFSSN